MIDTSRFVATYTQTLQSLFGKPVDRCSKFEQYTALVRMITNTAITNKTIPEDKTAYIKENQILFNKATFEKDAIIMKHLKSKKVYLMKENDKILSFEFEGFPYLAIWSKPKSHS